MDSSVLKFGGHRPSYQRPFTLDIQFFIPNEFFPFVWDAAKEWQHYSVSKSGIHSHRIVSLFNRGFNFGTAIDTDNDDLVAIWRKDQFPLEAKHEQFFQRISKYVKEGSYINLLEGGGRQGRTSSDEEKIMFKQWFFNGDCMIERIGKLQFTAVPKKPVPQYKLRLTSGRIVVPGPGGFYWYSANGDGLGGIHSYESVVSYMSKLEIGAVGLSDSFGNRNSVTEVFPIEQVESVLRYRDEQPRWSDPK